MKYEGSRYWYRCRTAPAFINMDSFLSVVKEFDHDNYRPRSGSWVENEYIIPLCKYVQLMVGANALISNVKVIINNL